MGSLGDVKDLIKETKDDKFLSWIFRIVFLFIGIAIIINIIQFYLDRYNNRPAKMLFGLAEYIPNKTEDTVLNFQKLQSPIHDTITMYPKEEKIRVIKQFLPKKTEDSSQKSKYNIHENNFDAPTQIGDNNTQNNDYTVKQRHITIRGLTSIYLKIPTLNTRIAFITPGDKESLNYATEIGRQLFARGYRNINPGADTDPAPMKFDTFDCKMDVDSIFKIHIYPASNVRE